MLPAAVAVREVGGDVLQPRVPEERLPAARAAPRRRSPGTLPEPEIHRRLVRALGALDDDGSRAAARRRRAHPGEGRGAVRRGVLPASRRATRSSRRCAPVVLYETLGPTLPDGAAAAAVLWGAAHTLRDELPRLGAARRLRRATGRRSARRSSTRSCTRRSGVVFTVDEYDETWRRLDDAGRRDPPRGPRAARRARARSRDEDPRARDPEFPFVLAAGERRTVDREHDLPRSRVAQEGRRRRAAHVSPADAARLGIADGGRARVTTKRGSVVATRRDHRHAAGPATSRLPNGLGLVYPDDDGRARRARRRAERAHRVGGSRLARRHAVAQARARRASRRVVG